MIAFAFVLIAFGWLGLYCGFTNRNPRVELVAAFGGSHSTPGASGMKA